MGYPCKITDGKFVEPCTSLAGAMDGSGFTQGRALYLHQTVNLSTLKPCRSFVVLRMGDHVQKGIALNVCPFCGERIDAPFADNDEADRLSTQEGGAS